MQSQYRLTCKICGHEFDISELDNLTEFTANTVFENESLLNQMVIHPCFVQRLDYFRSNLLALVKVEYTVSTKGQS